MASFTSWLLQHTMKLLTILKFSNKSGLPDTRALQISQNDVCSAIMYDQFKVPGMVGFIGIFWYFVFLLKKNFCCCVSFKEESLNHMHQVICYGKIEKEKNTFA